MGWHPSLASGAKPWITAWTCLLVHGAYFGCNLTLPQAVLSESQQIAALLMGVQTALYMINRLKAYLEFLAFLRDRPKTQPRANFETALIDFSGHTLQFLARAIQMYEKGGLSCAFAAFWKPEEIQNFESDCDKIAARVEIEASNCDRNLQKEHLQQALEELKEIRDIKNEVHEIKQSVHVLQIKIDLPCAEGATFDSHQEEGNARCHPDTRVDLLRKIETWAEDPQGKCVLWLHGMAGTGKSTISRTIAQNFHATGLLGASFFFKRGERDRGNASKLFTTLTIQLVQRVPDLMPYVRRAIDKEPAISGKNLKDQFNNLILQPLSQMMMSGASESLKLVLVVDALDECEGDNHIKSIIHLFSQTQSIRGVFMRILLTSRPELPLRLGFINLSDDAHQDVDLQEISRSTIQHDISTFFQTEFRKIREIFNCLQSSDSLLAPDWPGFTNIKILAEIANPLFIFAATVCRFIEDEQWHPQDQLDKVLKYQTASQASKLHRTYLPVLERLLDNQDDLEKKIIVEEFQQIIGSIILLSDPLSISSLASLLNFPHSTIDLRLKSLHSVLSIPKTRSSPVRILHLSFRDFLLAEETRNKTPFWVDEMKTHSMLADRCLELLSMRNCLRTNVCNLAYPGVRRSDIDRQILTDHIPECVRYACRFWVRHLEQSGRRISDQDDVHSFLQNHLLHWIEVLSLLGSISESIGLIDTLIKVRLTRVISISILFILTSPL
jgi:NACHT domain